MKTRIQKLIGALVVFLCLAGIAFGITLAQTGDGYDASWHTLESSGRVEASGGGYSLYGSAGQPDASVSLSGGGFSLTGGFWSGFEPSINYLPVIAK